MPETPADPPRIAVEPPAAPDPASGMGAVAPGRETAAEGAIAAARRDGAADALTAFAAHLFVLGRSGPEVEEAQLWADQVRSGFRTIPTGGGDLP